MPKIQNILDSLAVRNERFLQVALRKWFDFTQKQIRRDLTSKYEKSTASVTSELTDWELIETQGVTTIKRAAVEIMQSGGNAAYKHLAIEGSFDVINIPAVKAVNKFCSKLVTDVTANTKKGINTYIKHGIKQGYSMSKIARNLRPLVGLTGNQTQSVINYRNLLQVKRPDLSAAQLDKAVMKYTNKTHRQRMQTIARTETARAQNIGYCQGLEQVGLKWAEFSASDGACGECLSLDKTRYLVSEAAGVIPVHPRCRCAMLPVVCESPCRRIEEPLKEPPKGLPKLPKPTIPKPTMSFQQQQKIWLKNVSAAEKSSINRYTGEGNYVRIRNAQRRLTRKEITLETATKAEKSLLTTTSRIENLIDNAPVINKQIWRGMSFDKGDLSWKHFKTALDSGRNFSFNTMQSYSSSKAVANSFAKARDIRVHLTFKQAPRRTADISNLSKYKFEKEVLLGSNSEYRVASVTEKVGKKVTTYTYELEEVVGLVKALFVAKENINNIQFDVYKVGSKDSLRFTELVQIETDPNKIERIFESLEELKKIGV